MKCGKRRRMSLTAQDSGEQQGRSPVSGSLSLLCSPFSMHLPEHPQQTQTLMQTQTLVLALRPRTKSEPRCGPGLAGVRSPLGPHALGSSLSLCVDHVVLCKDAGSVLLPQAPCRFVPMTWKQSLSPGLAPSLYLGLGSMSPPPRCCLSLPD